MSREVAPSTVKEGLDASIAALALVGDVGTSNVGLVISADRLAMHWSSTTPCREPEKLHMEKGRK